MQREEGKMPSLALLLPRMEVRQHREQDQAEPHSDRKKLLERGGGERKHL